MRRYIRNTLCIVALASGVAPAVADESAMPLQRFAQAANQAAQAAGGISLTDTQKRGILQSVQSENGQAAPAGFRPSVGADVPNTVMLKPLPESAKGQVPSGQSLGFAKIQNNDVILVDQGSRKVVAVLNSSPTVGAGTSGTSDGRTDGNAAAIGNVTPKPED